MTKSDETLFDRVAGVAIAPAGGGDRKSAIVHVVFESADGTQVRCPLTVKAALSLRALLSSQLKSLVSDSDGEGGT